MMMRTMKIYRLSVLAVFVFSARAGAAMPVMSGSYALSFASTCPAQVATITNPGTGDLQNFLIVYPGAANTVVGVVTFTPSKGTLSVAGQSAGSGGLMQLQGGTALQPFNNSISIVNENYSNSSTSISLPFLGGTTPEFNAFYVTTSKGIAHAVAFSNLGIAGTGSACTQSGTLTSK